MPNLLPLTQSQFDEKSQDLQPIQLVVFALGRLAREWVPNRESIYVQLVRLRNSDDGKELSTLQWWYCLTEFKKYFNSKDCENANRYKFKIWNPYTYWDSRTAEFKTANHEIDECIESAKALHEDERNKNQANNAQPSIFSGLINGSTARVMSNLIPLASSMLMVSASGSKNKNKISIIDSDFIFNLAALAVSQMVLFFCKKNFSDRLLKFGVPAWFNTIMAFFIFYTGGAFSANSLVKLSKKYISDSSSRSLWLLMPAVFKSELELADIGYVLGGLGQLFVVQDEEPLTALLSSIGALIVVVAPLWIDRYVLTDPLKRQAISEIAGEQLNVFQIALATDILLKEIFLVGDSQVNIAFRGAAGVAMAELVRYARQRSKFKEKSISDHALDVALPAFNFVANSQHAVRLLKHWQILLSVGAFFLTGVVDLSHKKYKKRFDYLLGKKNAKDVQQYAMDIQTELSELFPVSVFADEGVCRIVLQDSEDSKDDIAVTYDKKTKATQVIPRHELVYKLSNIIQSADQKVELNSITIDFKSPHASLTNTPQVIAELLRTFVRNKADIRLCHGHFDTFISARNISNMVMQIDLKTKQITIMVTGDVTVKLPNEFTINFESLIKRCFIEIKRMRIVDAVSNRELVKNNKIVLTFTSVGRMGTIVYRVIDEAINVVLNAIENEHNNKVAAKAEAKAAEEQRIKIIAEMEMQETERTRALQLSNEEREKVKDEKQLAKLKSDIKIQEKHVAVVAKRVEKLIASVETRTAHHQNYEKYQEDARKYSKTEDEKTSDVKKQIRACEIHLSCFSSHLQNLNQAEYQLQLIIKNASVASKHVVREDEAAESSTSNATAETETAAKAKKAADNAIESKKILDGIKVSVSSGASSASAGKRVAISVGGAKMPSSKPKPIDHPHHLRYSGHRELLHLALEKACSIAVLEARDEKSDPWFEHIKSFAIGCEFVYCADAMRSYMLRWNKTQPGLYKQVQTQKIWEDIRNICKHLAETAMREKMTLFARQMKTILYEALQTMPKMHSKNKLALDQKTMAPLANLVKFSNTHQFDQKGEPVVLDETDFYKNMAQRLSDLQVYRERFKLSDQNYFSWLNNQIIPVINAIAKPLIAEKDAKEKLIKPAFYDFSHMLALRFLLMLCGELYNGQRKHRFETQRQLQFDQKPYSYKFISQDLCDFLDNAKNVRDSMGHDAPIAITDEDVIAACGLALKINPAYADPARVDLSYPKNDVSIKNRHYMVGKPVNADAGAAAAAAPPMPPPASLAPSPKPMS